ncbi:MAG TPA: hypothetical protein VFH29_08505, partial [Anaerolineales bacterium]|nr:hypothetical protein [Anaerolineales bacterium]
MTSNHDPAGIRRLAILLGAMLFLGSAYFFQDPEWNGNSRLDLTRAVVERGTLRIDDFHDAPGWATGDKAFFQGHYYSDKAIGTSMLAVPVYLLLYRLSAALGIPLEASLVKHVLTTCVVGVMYTVAGISMFAIAIRLARSTWIAFLATLGIAFGTMLWPYSVLFYGHVPTAGFLALAFASLLVLRDRDETPPALQWFWISLAMGMAFICDFSSAPVIMGLGAYALFLLWGRSPVRALQTAWPAIIGVAIPWMILIAYNLAVYGRPLEFGYSYEVEERFQEIMGLGFMGMRLPTLSAAYHITFDPKFGVFWQSPILLLAPLGYLLAWHERRNRAEALLSVYCIGVVFFMNAASYLWYGGSAFGPRLLISALPFFIVPLSMIRAESAWIMAGLGAWSVANMLIPLVGQIQYTRLEFDPERGGFRVDGDVFRGFSLLYGYGLSQVTSLQRLGKSPWTLGTSIGLPLWA